MTRPRAKLPVTANGAQHPPGSPKGFTMGLDTVTHDLSHQSTLGLLSPARTPGGIPNPGSLWEVIPSAPSLQNIPSRPFSGDLYAVCWWWGAQRAEHISAWTQRAHLELLMQGETVTSRSHPSGMYGSYALLQRFYSCAAIRQKFPRKELDSGGASPLEFVLGGCFRTAVCRVYMDMDFNGTYL